MPNQYTDQQLSVTVVVSAYNEAHNLSACVDSLLQQDRLPEAIVVVDDSSTDDSLSVLARYEENPRVRVMALSRNCGVPVARNAGAAETHSDIIVFFDADAFAPADWLACLLARFDDPAIAATGGPDRAPTDDSPFALAVDYSMRSWIASGRLRLNNPFTQYIPAGCNFAIRHDLFRRLGGFDERLNRRGEEKELIQRMRRGGHRIAFCADAFIWHRRRVSPKQFWRQNFLSGVARIDITRVAPDGFSWPHMAPGVLVLVLLAAGVQFAGGHGKEIAVSIIGLYLLLLLADAVTAAMAGTYRGAARWVPVTTATIHWGYGIGLIYGILRWLLRCPIGSGSAPTAQGARPPSE